MNDREIFWRLVFIAGLIALVALLAGNWTTPTQW